MLACGVAAAAAGAIYPDRRALTPEEQERRRDYAIERMRADFEQKKRERGEESWDCGPELVEDLKVCGVLGA